MKASLPRIAVDFASDIFRDLARRQAIFHRAFVAEIHHAGAAANRRDGKGVARLWRADFERAEVRTMAWWRLFGRDVDERDDVGRLLCDVVCDQVSCPPR